MKPLAITLALMATLAATLSTTGCSNSNSVAAPTMAVDTAPPAVPTGLNAATGHSAVKLNWRPNTADPDFQGFLVYRLAFGQVWPLTDTPIDVPHYLDRAPLLGTATYAVTSVDVNGNESSWVKIDFNYVAGGGPSITR